MKCTATALLLAMLFLTGCSTTPTSTPAASNLRNYNGTASVGDFLTITVDSSAQTIAYHNYTNGQNGTVPYTVNADGSYTITDPNGNLLAAYEIPGYAMVVEAANAGPSQDTAALITAIESVPASIQTFAGQNFNYTQFRTSDGGVEIGAVTIDSSGNITARSYDPGAIMWSQASYFNGGTMLASGMQEDPSGTFFTVTDESGSHSTVFGTQNGLWAVDNNNGGILGLPKASSKAFDSASAGTYNAIYYEKPNAQMINNSEVGTAVEGKATITVTATGDVTVTDSQSNVMANGTLMPVADAPYIYDGTQNTLPDPCYGLFTFRILTASWHQDVFVSFQGHAIIFSSFGTALPIQNNGTYTYFYGIGLK
jgi:archaellum component FlaF (FlaF/FlaG flagellin family)